MSEQPHHSARESGELASTPSPSAYPAYRKGRTAEIIRRGRLALFFIFCALRSADALIYFGGPVGERARVVAGIFTAALWSTPLLVGIWYRLNWCRAALAVVLTLNVFASMVLLHSAFQIPINYTPLGVLAAAALINAAAAWALFGIRDIGRLTSRVHGSHPYGYD